MRAEHTNGSDNVDIQAQQQHTQHDSNDETPQAEACEELILGGGAHSHAIYGIRFLLHGSRYRYVCGAGAGDAAELNAALLLDRVHCSMI